MDNQNIRYFLSNDSVNRIDNIKNLSSNIENIQINDKLKNLFFKLKKEYNKKDVFILEELKGSNKEKVKTHVLNWMKKWMGDDVEIYKELNEYNNKIYLLKTNNYPYFNLYYIGENLHLAEVLLKRAVVLNRLVKNFKDENLKNQISRINKSKCNITCEDEIKDNTYLKSIIRTNIYCFESDLKRILVKSRFSKENFDEELDQLKRKSLALTQGGQTFDKTNEVYVLKTSEMGKLFLHELIHYFNLDKISYYVRSGDNIEHIIKSWNIHYNTGGMFEAFTELYSNIISCMFMVCEYIHHNKFSKQIDFEDQSLMILNDLINIERLYSLYITAKLLYTYGYSKDTFIDFFENKNKKNYITLQGVVHAIVPYYIGRSILFNDLNNTFKDSTIDENFKIKEYYLENESSIFEKISTSDYYSNLKKCFNLIEESKPNLDLSYTCLDLNNLKLSFIKNILIKNKDNNVYLDKGIVNKIKNILSIQTGGSISLQNYYIKLKKEYLYLKESAI